jgi:tetratricopeptide (TPR) repeat protein
MNVIDSLQRLIGRKNRAGEQAPLVCPKEAEILRFSEHRLAKGRRTELTRHFTACGDCRDLLVFLARFQPEELDTSEALSHEAVRQQTARVLILIENDERKRRERPDVPAPRGDLVRARKGFFISYPQLATIALAVFTVTVGGIYWLTRSEKPEKEAMQALALSTKDERRSAARVSGDLAYSPYRATRGTTDTDDLQLQRALNKLKFAGSETAPVAARQMLARAHLAFDRPEHAVQARTILNQLIAGGLQSAEVFNDLGVAEFQLDRDDEAIAVFTRALDQAPAYAEAVFNRALAEERAKRYPEAQRDWQRFITLSSDANWKAEAERHLASLSTSSAP